MSTETTPLNNVSDRIQQNTLLSLDKPENDEIAAQIAELKVFIAGDTMMDNTHLVPRFGLLSLKMRNTQIYAYDHPALMKISNTAFTDGMHIFISSQFLQTLKKEEAASMGVKQGAVPLILRQLIHMLNNHAYRLTQFPKPIANRAEALSTNAQLEKNFGQIHLVPSLLDAGISLEPDKVEKYAKLAEETIARELMEKQKQGQGKSKSGKGTGQPQGQQEEFWSDNHTITPEELIDTLAQNGLEHVLDALELPRSSEEIERISEIQEQVRLKDVDAILQAASQKAQMDGHYPSAQIVDSCSEMIKGFSELPHNPSWELGLKQFVLGDNISFRYKESKPKDLYFIDMDPKKPKALSSESRKTKKDVVLCLIDVSGGADLEQIKAFCSKTLELSRESSQFVQNKEIVLMFSNSPIQITQDNIDEILNNPLHLRGKGGTDLASDLQQTMKLPVLKNTNIRSVCFFTDLCDTPPKKSDFPSNLSLCFITTHHPDSKQFTRAVKDFARVYHFDDYLEATLHQEQNQNAPAMQLSAKRSLRSTSQDVAPKGIKSPKP